MTFEYSGANPDAPVAYASLRSMNTVLEMVLTGVDENRARETAETVKALVAGLEKTFDRFDPASELSEVNRAAPDGEVTVGDDMYMALELCRAFHAGTKGYFDITATAGSGEGGNEGSPEKKEAEMKTGSGYVLDPAARTVRFTAPGTALDMGGFAKGYALQKIRETVAGQGIGNALFNFGNSSVLGMGHHPFGDYWAVGIERQGVQGGNRMLRDSALSVSGLAGSGRAHIADPHTGRMRTADELVVVEGISPLVCEVLSTALYAAPGSERIQIMENFDGYSALVIDDTGGRIRI